MSPLSFEWHWNADYLIFMGLLYVALAVIGAGLVYTLLKTWMDLEGDEHDLPPELPGRKKYHMY